MCFFQGISNATQIGFRDQEEDFDVDSNQGAEKDDDDHAGDEDHERAAAGAKEKTTKYNGGEAGAGKKKENNNNKFLSPDVKSRRLLTENLKGELSN